MVKSFILKEGTSIFEQTRTVGDKLIDGLLKTNIDRETIFINMLAPKFYKYLFVYLYHYQNLFMQKIENLIYLNDIFNRKRMYFNIVCMNIISYVIELPNETYNYKLKTFMKHNNPEIFQLVMDYYILDSDEVGNLDQYLKTVYENTFRTSLDTQDRLYFYFNVISH
jgi:hypothetical protein